VKQTGAREAGDRRCNCLSPASLFHYEALALPHFRGVFRSESVKMTLKAHGSKLFINFLENALHCFFIRLSRKTDRLEAAAAAGKPGPLFVFWNAIAGVPIS
jgi:hypothetical protein